MVLRVSEEEYKLLLGGPPLPVQMKPGYRRVRKTKQNHETPITGACLDLLHIWGINAWRHNTGGYLKKWKRKDGTEGQNFIRYGFPGSGDIIGMTFKTARFFSIETKTPEGELQQNQRDFRASVLKHGGIYIVARSQDILQKHKEELMS